MEWITTPGPRVKEKQLVECGWSLEASHMLWGKGEGIGQGPTAVLSVLLCMHVINLIVLRNLKFEPSLQVTAGKYVKTRA